MVVTKEERVRPRPGVGPTSIDHPTRSGAISPASISIPRRWSTIPSGLPPTWTSTFVKADVERAL